MLFCFPKKSNLNLILGKNFFAYGFKINSFISIFPSVNEGYVFFVLYYFGSLIYFG